MGDVEHGVRAAAPRAGSAARAARVRTGSLGHDRQRLQARSGGSKRDGLAVGADHEAAAQRGGDVVGVALQLARQREQVGVQLEQVVGGHQPGDDRRGARAEPAGRAGSPSGSGT